MPGTSSTPTSEASLSAALEDAEGQALVQDIVIRKEWDNAVETLRQQLLFGDVLTDGHGTAIPRELDDYWRNFIVSGRGHGKTARAAAAFDGPRSAMAWLDEHIALLAEEWQDPHQEVRDLICRTPWAEPSTVPEVASVRWACKAPTTPVYAEGTYGWMLEQMEARISPAMREHNRKLSEKEAELVSRFARGLGIGGHGTDG